MNVLALFGISTLMSLIASGVIAKVYVWPRLRVMNRDEALRLLVMPHMLLRFIGLSFLVPGVVSASLPAGFAVPAAAGDFVAGILAIAATVALSGRKSWAAALVWVFNIWGAADFLIAFVQAQRVGIDPGAFGAAFFIPTAIVPPLFITHGLIFRLLLRAK
ncbi:MAG: hypothetical protein ABSG69_14350 [Candidatus Acidiferrum sp.]